MFYFHRRIVASYSEDIGVLLLAQHFSFFLPWKQLFLTLQGIPGVRGKQGFDGVKGAKVIPLIQLKRKLSDNTLGLNNNIYVL